MGNLVSGEDFSGIPTAAGTQPIAAEPDWFSVAADLRSSAQAAAPDRPRLRQWSGKVAAAAAQLVLNALADAIERNLTRSKLQPMPDHDGQTNIPVAAVLMTVAHRHLARFGQGAPAHL